MGVTFIHRVSSIWAIFKTQFLRLIPLILTKQVFVVISLCLNTTINKSRRNFATSMARNIIMQVRMDKKGRNRKIIAPKFVLIFRSDSILYPHLWTFHYCFYFQWVLRLLIQEETKFLIKLSADLTSIWSKWLQFNTFVYWVPWLPFRFYHYFFAYFETFHKTNK